MVPWAWFSHTVLGRVSNTDHLLCLQKCSVVAMCCRCAPASDVMIDAAKAAVAIARYPPLGHRSIGAHFPQLNCATLPQSFMMPWMEQNASTVIVMCETVGCLDQIDDVAAIPGVDGILIGTFDLCTSLGVLDDWENPKMREAFSKVGAACHKHGKIFGVAGLNHLPEMLSWVIHHLGARLVISKGDMAIVSDGLKTAHDTLRKLEQRNGAAS